MLGPKRFRLYIDESGDHTYQEHPDHPQKRYLCLTGIILPYSKEDTVFEEEFYKFKHKYFEQKPGCKEVVLHRDEIVKRKGLFSILNDEQKNLEYETDFLKLLNDVWFKVIAVTIDKIKHQEIYGGFAFHPYHYCMQILLERYCGWMNLCGHKGDVIAESRGKVEDERLKEAYSHVFNFGTIKKKPKFFQQSLTTKNLKIGKKEENIYGLQLADLLAHPCKQDILIEVKKYRDARSDFVKKICKCLDDSKYNRRLLTNEIWFWGKYYLPNLSNYD